MSPLDLKRLAIRIERLQRMSRHGWSPADDLEFKNKLPGGRDSRRALPDPKDLREWAKTIGKDLQLQRNIRPKWRQWITTTLNLESAASSNDPRNPKRIMRDLSRGRFPRRAAVARRYLARQK